MTKLSSPLHLAALTFSGLFFSFCLAAQAPSNDNCSGAVTLVPSASIACNATGGTTLNATPSPEGAVCAGNPNDDVWYKFVATSTSHIVSVTGSSNFDAVVAVYAGSCGGASIGCKDASFGGGTETLIFTTLTIGSTYFVKVFDYYNNAGSTFTICVTTPAPPPNDDCSGAIELTVGEFCNYTQFTNLYSTGSNVPNPVCSNGYQGGDVWFKLTVPVNGKVQIDCDEGVVEDGIMEVYTGSCGNLSYLACDYNSSVNGYMPYLNLTGLSPGSTLYIRFWEYENNVNGTFSICAYSPQPITNDECSGAKPLTVTNTCNYVQASNVDATASANVPAPGCGSYSGGDVWFSATVPANGKIILESQEIDFSDGAMAVYTGACNNLTVVDCDDDSGPGTMPYLSLSGLVPGSTIYIRFWEYGNNSFGTFGICAYEPSAPPTIERDLSAAVILSPQSGCQLPAQQTIKIRVANLGSQPQSNFQVRYIANNQTVTETVTGTVTAGGTLDYTFIQKANLPPATGGYSIQALTLLANEQNPANDLTTKTFYNLISFDAGVSDGVSVCQGNGTYLYAYGGSGATYLWSNNLGNQSSVYVTPSGTTQYTVTVTNNLGCTDVDTVKVSVLTQPAQPVISFSGSSPQFCQGGNLTLTSSIATNILWSTGATTPSIVVNQAGYYRVKHVNALGCEQYSVWIYVSVVPTPTLGTLNPGAAVCPGGSEKITVGTSGGGTYTYLWSTGAVTNNITVTPAQTTTYTVTVTNVNLGCVNVLSKTITVLSNAAPPAVTNLLPVSGTQNISAPVSLSWSPSPNASYYEVWVWKQGSPQSFFTTTAQISVLYYPAQYGVTYEWKVIPKSPCNTGPMSAIQSFSSAPASDIIVSGINVPSGNVFSGAEASFSWQVDNIGQGSAGATFWYDGLLLSPDSTCTTANDDQFIGGKLNPSALLPADPPYTSNLTYSLPNGIEGKRYVLVLADYLNYLPESNDNNNCRVAGTALMIELTPPPDLRVLCNQVVLPGVGNTALAGQTYPMSWTVKNQGLGPTLSGGWYDRVYLSADTVLSPFSDYQLAVFYRNGDLEVGESYTNNASVTIPAQIGGNYYLFVVTDYGNEEFEHNYEFNNSCRSGAINIIAIPKPDFIATAIQASPATVSHKDVLTVSWSVSNQGIPYTGSLSDFVYINTQPNLNGGSPRYLGSYSQTGNFQTGSGVNRQLDVSIPDDINGTWYIFVKADGNGSISESNEDNNAVNPQQVTVQSPDLTVPAASIHFPASLVSGQNFTVSWAVRNNGPGKLLPSNLKDEIGLSLSPSGSNPIPLGSEFGSVSIFSNADLNRQRSFVLPPAISGQYYVVVHTNPDNAIYEAGLTGNNLGVSALPVQIQLAKFPDLHPLKAMEAPATAAAGSTVYVSYEVKNDGDTAVTGSWQDRIYLKSSPGWSLSGAVLLKSVARSQVLPADSIYREENIALNIPVTNLAGQYYLFVVSDAGNTIFELNHEDNNVSPGKQIAITTTLNVDLTIQPTLVPGNIVPGVPAFLSWKVRNNGASTTPTGTWEDRLYLSATPGWPATGALLASWPHGGSLAAGHSYEGSGTFTIPTGQTGAYYLILVTDPEQKTADNFFDDNYVALSPSSGGGTIVITYPPAPDLEVISVEAPVKAQSGQPLQVIYKVRNNGPGNYKGVVTDVAYRSTDLEVNGGDIALATKSGTVDLPKDAIYMDTMSFSFPANDSGNILILIKTNANNLFNEVSTTNNTGFDYLVVQQPPPADLSVENVVALPSNALIGNQLNVTWRVRNIGSNPLTGQISEGVYLSEDEQWDVTDALLGTHTVYLSLTPGNAAPQSLSKRLENVSHKPYRVIVRTDILNNYPEQDENNNLGSGGPVSVVVPELPLNIVTPAIIPNAKPVYYRIEIPANLAGEMLSVEIMSDDLTAFNELYLRYGKVPDRSTYDVAFDQPFSRNQRLIVPALQAGTYYVMAFAAEGPDPQPVTLLARIVPFTIEKIQADKGGNTGSVTVLLSGTKFDPGLKVWLENTAGSIIAASQVNYVSPLSAYATFPLSGVTPGKFDVKAINSVQDSTALTDGFEVIAGTIGNNPVAISCTFDPGFSPFTLNALSPIDYEAQYPASARPNQVVAMTFRVENTGTVDIPVPHRLVTSVGGAPLSKAVGELSQDLRELPLEFSEDNAPPEVLRPGGVSYRTIFTKAIRLMQFNVIE